MRRYLIGGFISLLLAFSIMWSRGLFSAETLLDRYMILSDGFFVAGMLVLSFGLLIFVAQNGAFDAIRFALNSFFSFLRPKERRDKYVTYADYKAALEEKEKLRCGFLIIPGIVLLVLAGLFTMLFMGG